MLSVESNATLHKGVQEHFPARLCDESARATLLLQKVKVTFKSFTTSLNTTSHCEAEGALQLSMPPRCELGGLTLMLQATHGRPSNDHNYQMHHTVLASASLLHICSPSWRTPHTMKETKCRCITLSDVQLGNGSWPSCRRAYACCSAEAAPGDHLLHRQELYLHNSRIGQIQEDLRQIKLFRRPHNICSVRGLCCRS